MKIDFKKFFVVAGLAAAIILASGGAARAVDQTALLAQIELVKRQIMELQIQLLQIQIAQLQDQLARLPKPKPFISVISPDGGQIIRNDKVFSIRWESSRVEKVSLNLETPESSRVIAQGVIASLGRYDWQVNDVSGDNFKIKIFDKSDPQTSASSAKVFSIVDPDDICSDDTLAGKCSQDLPKYCDYNKKLSDNCSKCGCPSGKICHDDGICRYKNACSDQTPLGQCSSDQPKLCFDLDLDLIDACKSCGCPAGETCGSDSKCH